MSELPSPTPPPEAPPKAGGGLGTFLGVFTPTMLTILGVIMYLRAGWVVGNAGVGLAVLIVALSCSITFITSLSVSSMATNMRVGVGGAYFIISRSLGLEIGGAIGLPLFLSQAISVTLYCYGLAEAFRILWPGVPIMPTAGVLVLAVSAMAARSTVFALKAQIPILVLVALSIGSLFAGGSWSGGSVPLVGEFPDASFWEVFAVFFPAVTGILAGVSMSGDLKDPARSLPLGTLLAVAAGSAIYLALPVVLGNSADLDALRTDSLVWTKVAAVPFLVLPGLFGAILSSAIGSILGAPRTLQALAEDRLVHGAMREVDEKTGEPTKALYLSAAVAFVAVFLGDLNAVATVVSMFFLTTYGVVNVVCGLEGLIGSPHFRPRFRVHWAVPLLGALGCFQVMMLINGPAAVAAIVIELGVWVYLSRRAMKATWGDMRGGIVMSVAIAALTRNRHREEDARNWRPHILVFTSDVKRNAGLIRLANGFGLERGLLTVATLVKGNLDDIRHSNSLAAEADAYLSEQGITAFCEVDVVPDLESGMVTVAQANGIAGLASNTVMLGWPDRDQFFLPALRVMRRLDHLGKCLLIARLLPRPLPKDRRMLIWWSGKQDNGDLMLLLAHLLRQNREWRSATVTLRSIVDAEDKVAAQRRALQHLINESRIDARAEVIVRGPEDNIPDLLTENSQDAELVFLGLAVPEPGEEEAVAERVRQLVEGLPSTILVRNSGPFRGQLL
ncbi:MAG: Na-K-Cl cotransporter [Alphaproteobacteria bacterium]|nr:Na-K-Cl cotransporter [Alphaproteobacteria bacterium]